nr:hypothetical protein [Bacteroidota bacterium]
MAHKLFGWPQFVSGINVKTINIPGAETIDDTYHILLHGEYYNLSLTVDTVSRYAVRNLLINGSDGMIKWTWENNYVEIFSASKNEWNKVEFKKENAQPGYNENIIENMYVEELQQFIDTTLGSATFFNTMEYDFVILQLLYTIEKSWSTKTILPCDKTSLIKINENRIGIVARVESTRLPRKHFIDVEGKCFIEWLLLRMTHHFESEIKTDNIKIIIATADTKLNREFLQLKEKYSHLEIYFGSEKNIPQRLWQCAEHYNLDYVVNIDGDDVLCSPLAVEKTIAAQIKNSDYIFTSGLPLGMNCISISKKFLTIFLKVLKIAP